MAPTTDTFHATTVACVRHKGRVALAGDGQVSIGQTIVKAGARKVRKVYHGRVLAGFAGAAADAFTLFAKFEAKLEEHRGNLSRAAVELRDEVAPKNIIMIGPTGVGKTEIARRLAKLSQAPFIKVEASKYTEVGYVGRDVESMIRDLTELSVTMVKAEMAAAVRERAEVLAEERVLDLLLPRRAGEAFSSGTLEEVSPDASRDATRDKLRAQLRAGKLDERMIELDVQAQAGPMFEIFSGQGMEEVGMNIKDMLANLMPGKTRRRRVKVGEARRLLAQEEAQKLVDVDEAVSQAIRRVEDSGIVFLDELDKIAGREGAHGPDVSREGVQRDLLPIVEGSSGTTKYGMVRTDHILFIAAGAFHVSQPSDLIPA